MTCTGCATAAWPVVMGPGLAATRRPGTTARLRRLLLRGLITQRAAQDLADRRLWQLITEFDDLRALVVGEFARHEFHQLGLGERRIAPHHEGLHGLTRRRIRHADYRAFEHARMHRDHV